MLLLYRLRLHLKFKRVAGGAESSSAIQLPLEWVGVATPCSHIFRMLHLCDYRPGVLFAQGALVPSSLHFFLHF